MENRKRLVLSILIPFACGYFLSYLLRNVNAIIAPELVRTFKLNAADLGLLTSAYFFTFAFSQPLLGICLDRFGPRRVEGTLLLFAALGSLLFGISGSLSGLIIGRSLIGLGVSVCLMAGLKANALWFHPHRLGAMNGWILAGGGLGVVFSTAPVSYLLGFMTWRDLFYLFALAFFAVSIFIFSLVPEKAEKNRPLSLAEQIEGFRLIVNNVEFWRITPLVMFSQSTFMSIAGLWAAHWMKDVAGYGRYEIANYLFLAAISMMMGHIFLGNLASRLARSGISQKYVVGLGVALAVLLHSALAFGYTGMPFLVWLLFGFLGCAGTVSFAIVAQLFPTTLVGRANAILNLMVFVATFFVQWGMGVMINYFPTGIDSYAPKGYALAFGMMALCQSLALIHFFYPHKRASKFQPV